MQGHCTDSEDRMCALGLTGDGTRSQKATRELLCVSPMLPRAYLPLLRPALLPLSLFSFLSLSALKLLGLQRREVQDGCPTVVASQPSSQGLPFTDQQTLPHISKSQLPRKKWLSLVCIPNLGQSTVVGNSGHHVIQVSCRISSVDRWEGQFLEAQRVGKHTILCIWQCLR